MTAAHVWLVGSLVCLSGCVPVLACSVRADVAFLNHPAGKPRPAAMVIARCEDGRTAEWICDNAVVSEQPGEVTVDCDSKRILRARERVQP